MENDVKLKQALTKFLEDGKLKAEYKEKFDKFYAFTEYKLIAARHFIEQLKRLEELGKTQGQHSGIFQEATICWDSVDYMLMGAYDGLLYQIYHVLRFDFPENKRYFDVLMDKLSENIDNDIFRLIHNLLAQAKGDWEGILYDERNEWTHRKLPVYRNASWKRGEKITFQGAFQEDENSEELVEKLEGYHHNMSNLIDGIYGLLSQALEH